MISHIWECVVGKSHAGLAQSANPTDPFSTPFLRVAGRERWSAHCVSRLVTARPGGAGRGEASGVAVFTCSKSSWTPCLEKVQSWWRGAAGRLVRYWHRVRRTHAGRRGGVRFLDRFCGIFFSLSLCLFLKKLNHLVDLCRVHCLRGESPRQHGDRMRDVQLDNETCTNGEDDFYF